MDNIKSLWKRTEGTILLEDGQTTCKRVYCSRGFVVKDIIDQVSQELEIAPIARPFFALCDPINCIPLNPYHSLTHDEARKSYQFRVFINTGENSFQFMKISKQAYQYYYRQLKEDFVSDRLYPRTTINTALFLAAIDIARAAHENNLDYRDVIVSSKDLTKFMPKFLKEKYKKDNDMEKKLRDTFSKFKDIRKNLNGLDHYEAKYMEVYEKDMMCGKHIFRIKSNEPKSRKNMTLLLVLSWKEGIQQVWAGENSSKVEKNQELVCSIRSITSIQVDNLTVTVSLIKERDDDSAMAAEEVEKKVLNFCEKFEAQSFAVIVQTYFQIMVDANAVIISGLMAPAENFLRVAQNPKDGLKAQLCHAPIPPHYVKDTLSKNGLKSDGNFLIRESRNQHSAYTLSLCYNGSVMCYRIAYDPGEGFSFQDPNSEEEARGGAESHKHFPTLLELVQHHEKVTEGLPSVLKMNYAPEVTGPIPLLRVQERASSTDCLSNFPAHINTPFDCTSTSSSGSPHSSTSSPYTPTSDNPQFPIHSDSNSTNHIKNVPSQQPESSYIRELIEEGVVFVQYADLVCKNELGSGHYSTVYLAELGTGSNMRNVAMKIPTMRDFNVDIVKQDLKREILTMNSLNHDNIVKVLGISETRHYLNFIGMLPVMIMEFVNGGCLRSYLNKMDMTKLHIIKENFLLYGKQIADGMNYLEQRKVIHRDLATRNVLMVSEKYVKISDFGLARKPIEQSDYYRAKANTDLPIYWYSPESLETSKFSTQGDVWSYGVTVWEMFSLGGKPSQLLKDLVNSHKGSSAYRALAAWFRSGNRLRCTSMARDIVTILYKCWDLNPQERPSFVTLSEKMNELHTHVRRRNATMASTASTSSSSKQPSMAVTTPISSTSNFSTAATAPSSTSGGSSSSSGGGGTAATPKTAQNSTNFAVGSASSMTPTPPITPLSSMPMLGSRAAVALTNPPPVSSTFQFGSATANGSVGMAPISQPGNGFSTIPSIMGSSSGSGSAGIRNGGAKSHTSFSDHHSQWTGSSLMTSPVLLNSPS